MKSYNFAPVCIFLMSIVFVLAVVLLLSISNSLKFYKDARDLCAWNARQKAGDVNSEEATRLWKRIITCKTPCTFCGQLHDQYWISRNTWEAQVNTMKLENK